MKRAITVVIALAVVGLFGYLATQVRFTEQKVPLPLRGEAFTNPFYAAIEFADEFDADAAWEHAFATPAADSVVYLSDWNWSLSGPRRLRLQKWVEDGGRLVVDDSLLGDLDTFVEWSGISALDHPGKSDAADDAEEEPDDSKKAEKSGAGDFFAQFFHRDCVALEEDGTKRTFSVCGLGGHERLASTRKMQWSLRHDGKLEAVRVAVGRGSVTVLNAQPFERRDFLMGDHARLFVAATQLRHDDAILFLTEDSHGSIVKLLWRYGYPVVILLGLMVALALWRAAARFGPPTAPTETARRSLAEQIRGTGQFALRFGGGRALHAASARALRDAAITRLPNYDRLGSEDRIAALVKLTSVSADDLRPALNYSGARSAHELRNSIAALETARRLILAKNKRSKHGN
jgi:hypothetical protein